MLRGPLHNRGTDGQCEACGEPFPCPDGLAIYAAVKRELEATLNVSHRVEPDDEPEPVRASERAEGRYRMRFVKHASSGSVEPRIVTHVRAGEERTLIWRPSRNPNGDGCFEHFTHEPIRPDDHSPRAEEVRAQVRKSFEANRHAGSWWSEERGNGATIFDDCQVEVLAGPL